MKRASHNRGFSLVESAVSLVILGLLTVALIAYWKMAGQQRVLETERDVLAQSEEALVGFAHANYRLPCPDTDGDGAENCDGGTQLGTLPWQTLGIADMRARGMRYGVYRNGNAASPWLDTDLTAQRDRFRPLVTTISSTTAPASADTLLGNSNLLDLCYALGTASTAPVDPGRLHTVEVDTGGANILASRRNMAFALAMPGLLDANGNGSRFDGNQAVATAASPVFDTPSRRHTATYDDQVRSIAFDTLFARLSCGQALSAAGHAHFNAAGSAAFMQQGLSDYKAQLELASLMAGAAVASATAGAASATAGLANAVAVSATAVAEAILSYGATSGIIAAGVAAVVANTAAVATSVGTLASAIAGAVEADKRVTEVAPLVTDSATLASQVNANALAADAAGF